MDKDRDSGSVLSPQARMSDFLVWLIFFIPVTLIFNEFNVSGGMTAVVSLMIYLTIGEIVKLKESISPELTDRMKSGRIDFSWGWLNLYWKFWWPYYLLRREPSERG